MRDGNIAGIILATGFHLADKCFMVLNDDAALEHILRTSRTIAVVGLSSDPSRPSYDVAEYLQRAGYRIIPVNPNETEVLGVPAVASLRDLPSGSVDIVDIFRRPAEVGPHIDEALAIGAPVVWLQLGTSTKSTVERAIHAGLDVVVERCMLVEHGRLIG